MTNTRDGTLSVISRDTHKVIKTIRAGRKTNRLALAPDGRTIFVINDGKSHVRILDAVTPQFTGRMRSGRDPYNMAFSPEGNTPIS